MKKRLSTAEEYPLLVPSRWSPTGWYLSLRRLINQGSSTMRYFKSDHPRAKHRSDSQTREPLTTEARSQFSDKLQKVRRAMNLQLPPMHEVSRSQDFDASSVRYYEVTLGGMFGTPTCVQNRKFILHRGAPLPVVQQSFSRRRDELSVWGDTLVTRGLVTKPHVF